MSLKKQALETLRGVGMTADEVAYVLVRSPLAVRPRISELSNENLIHDTGQRRKNASGKPAIVWIACAYR